MPVDAIKQRLDRFVFAVRKDLKRVHGEKSKVILLRDRDCPYHLEAPLDYQTLKIRCVIDKITQEDIRLCREYKFGGQQAFVRLIAIKKKGERGYKMHPLENLVNE